MIDSHCHLDVCEGDSGALVDAARTAGLGRIATVGTDADSIRRSLALVERHDEVYAIVGRHPHETTGFDDAGLAEIEAAATHTKARAIGETGLDYYRDHSPRPDQVRAFESQIDLARRLDMPLVIHTRAAEEDTFRILAERGEGLTVVIHCFSAPDRLAECVEHGYMCSFAGNVTYPSAGDLAEAAAAIPAELLLFETDAPYLAPQPLRGRPNEPANVVETARFVAAARGVEPEELEQAVDANAARVFGW